MLVGRITLADQFLYIGKMITEETRRKMREAKLGKPGNNRGKHWKFSPEALAKRIGKPSSFKGRTHSEETKRLISLHRIGLTTKENNPAWKGGKRSENYIVRREVQRKMQKKVFERDNYTCTMCNTKGGILHVDHIQSFAEYIEGRFDMNNLRTLCVKCHYIVTFNKPMPKDSRWGKTFMKGGNQA